jgi:hypothetical protein
MRLQRRAGGDRGVVGVPTAALPCTGKGTVGRGGGVLAPEGVYGSRAIGIIKGAQRVDQMVTRLVLVVVRHAQGLGYV